MNSFLLSRKLKANSCLPNQKGRSQKTFGDLDLQLEQSHDFMILAFIPSHIATEDKGGAETHMTLNKLGACSNLMAKAFGSSAIITSRA